MRWTGWVCAAAMATALTGGGAPALLAADDTIENTDNGHWYRLVTSSSPLDWTACETDAQKAGGYLAAIDSDAENDWIWKYLVSNVAETYIGGSDAANEGTWVWSNGEGWNYTNWAKGEPDDQKGYQNYVVTGGQWSNQWADDEGSASGKSQIYSYVIEWDKDPNGGPPTAPPEPPTELKASFLAGGGITLSWTDASSDETGFHVERHPASYAFAHLVTTGADATGHNDQLLYPSTTFVYRVRAFNDVGVSAWSNEASATTTAEVPVPGLPAAPSQLVATPGAGANGLSWNDNSFDEVRFAVERAVGADDFKPLTTVDTDVTAASDAAPPAGWPCTYRVRALALQGPSPYSNPATAQQPGTIEVTSIAGSLTDSPKPRKDKLKLAAVFASPAPLDPVADGLALQLGAVNAPVSVTIGAADSAWKVKTKKGVRVSAAWKSAKGAFPAVAITVDFVKHTLTATVTGADFRAAPSTSVRLLLGCGADGGARTATWPEKKPGSLVSD